MKKSVRVLSAIIGSALLAVSMSACSVLNGASDKNTPTQQSSQKTSIVYVSHVPAYESFQAYLDDPDIKKQFDKDIKKNSSKDYEQRYFVEGEKHLVFEYKYLPADLSLMEASQADYLKEYIESTLSSGAYMRNYTLYTANLQRALDDKSVTVIVRYVDKSGATLGEKEYIPVTSRPEVS